MECMNNDFSIKPFGLHNTGAICWMNSLFQAMGSITEFNELLLRYESEFEKRDNKTALVYIKMLNKETLMNSNTQNTDVYQTNNYSTLLLNELLEVNKLKELEKCIASLVPFPLNSNELKYMLFANRVLQNNEQTKFKNAPQIGKINKYIQLIEQNEVLQRSLKLYKDLNQEHLSFGQNSSSEGFVKLIEKLNCEPIENMFNVRYLMKIQCPNCKQTVSEKRDHSCHIELFDQVNLQTEQEFVNFIHAHESEIDEYTCEKCNVKNKKIKKIEKLRMLRECVVFIFNKYYRKTNRWYPQKFQIEKPNNKFRRYELMATVEHSGGLHGGHYWARGKRNGVWYNFNDSHVQKISNNVAEPTSATYMIFYQLTMDDAPRDESPIEKSVSTMLNNL